MQTCRILDVAILCNVCSVNGGTDEWEKYFNEDAMAVVKATNVSIAKANESIKKIPKIDSYFQELKDRLK